MVIFKYTKQIIDLNTFTNDSECVLYAVLDPTDTWDIDESPFDQYCDDNDDNDDQYKNHH